MAVNKMAGYIFSHNPVNMEPNGIARDDGKRPDGMTLVPWRHGKSLIWDATCVDTLAVSHIQSTSRVPGGAAATAESLKRRKYAALDEGCVFVPVGVETMEPWGPDGQSFSRILYGALLIFIAVVMILIDPLGLMTKWALNMNEGSFLYNMWEDPSYQLVAEVWMYNYTNVPEYLSGEDKVMKLEQIGPFVFREYRRNKNITLDKERGVMTLMPDVELKFVRNQSIGDIKDVQLYVPNIAVVLMSTFMADKLNYFANSGAYFSIKALGIKLFKTLTVDEVLWGYEDPMITIANSLLPGWIDFKKLGIVDRFYAKRKEVVEVELGNESKKFSLNSWNGSPGIVEQGFTDLNTSVPCNRIKGSYEGLMLPSHVSKDEILPIYRKAACRIMPFVFQGESRKNYNFNYYRFELAKTAFDNTSDYACSCTHNCVPNGFVDVSNCYYGFSIAVSKPQFLDADPLQISYYEGLHPDPKIHTSVFELEPVTGAPIRIHSMIQVNMAVRTSPGNPITQPLKDKIVPILWLSLTCKSPPPEVLTLLNVRLTIAPALIITIEATLLIIGAILGANGFYRIYRPRYELVEYNEQQTELDNTKSDQQKAGLKTPFENGQTDIHSASLLSMINEIPESMEISSLKS
ncbi:scavenger receptor class B member 1 [Aphomia sociella]